MVDHGQLPDWYVPLANDQLDSILDGVTNGVQVMRMSFPEGVTHDMVNLIAQFEQAKLFERRDARFVEQGAWFMPNLRNADHGIVRMEWLRKLNDTDIAILRAAHAPYQQRDPEGPDFNRFDQ